MKSVWLGFVLLAGLVSAAGAQDAGRNLLFSMDREGPPAIQYSIVVSGSGQGSFANRLVTEIPAAPNAEGDAKAIHIAPGLLKKLFAAVPMVEGGRCETHNKGIAKTGVKTLRYAGAGRTGLCVFNYSDDDRVNDAATAFEAIAETMRYGERLASKLRFDRLGLDTELGMLQSAVSDGRALEVGNIAPVLKSISEDERVMDRVRRKADQLLQAAGPAESAGGDSSAR